LTCWWQVFRDPTLDELIRRGASQNLTVREAGYRVLQARAAAAIARGYLFPQQQNAAAGFSQNALSKSTANSSFLQEQFFPQWDAGFNLAWELDFWGRFRRAVEAADADLDASVFNFDQVLVTLLGDIGATYADIRTTQRRIALARENLALQRDVFTIADARFRGGQVSELDVDQATSTLAQTEALIPQLELQLREANNRLCILLGTSPEDMTAVLAPGPIPAAPVKIVIGIPADLLRRRPDVRRAEREVAAQSARVGIATSELYPHIAVTGSIGVAASQYGDLFEGQSLQGSIGPSLQWNVLNYGRLLNNIRQQDARLCELIAAYQNSVLQANGEAEDGIATFLREQQRTRWLAESVAASEKAMNVAKAQYRAGVISFNWVALIEQNLVQQQDLLAQSQGQTAQGLVETYRALGGGW
jgi:NodT family efflux transporter outer membrane factor (OMF) lipoprotein